MNYQLVVRGALVAAQRIPFRAQIQDTSVEVNTTQLSNAAAELGTILLEYAARMGEITNEFPDLVADTNQIPAAMTQVTELSCMTMQRVWDVDFIIPDNWWFVLIVNQTLTEAANTIC